MKSCLHCNGENRDQAQFCGHCGHPFSFLTEAPTETASVAKERKTDTEVEQDRKPRAGFRAGVLIGIFLLLLGQMLWAEGQSFLTKLLEPKDIVENRKTAAEQYQAVEKLEERFAEAVQAQAQEMPTGLHEMIFTRITQNIRIEKLKSAQLELLVKYFTVKELEALRRFYETPEGASLQKKLAKLEEEFQPQVATEALHAVQETLRELQDPPRKSPSEKDM